MYVRVSQWMSNGKLLEAQPSKVVNAYTTYIYKINRYAKQKWAHVQTQTQIEQYLFMRNQNRHGLHLLLNDVH